VPVTLKMRTGWCAASATRWRWRARRSAGVAMLTVHGRTREQGYRGQAEYDTMAAVKAALRIPVVANGDIDARPRRARAGATGADALMIGRAAQGRPWIFGEIAHFLATGAHRRRRPRPRCALAAGAPARPLRAVRRSTGVRSARKHIGWAVTPCPAARPFAPR
jgi:tRNA-dihydrouridine synthase B